MTTNTVGTPLAIGVVGASGFLSGHLVPALKLAGHVPRVFGRTQSPTGDVHPPPSHPSDLAGLDVVVHLAGIAHQKATDEDYASVNIDFATSVASLCRDAGVGRLMYISTSQVHGRYSDSPIGPQSPYNPPSAYASSKMRAEIELKRLLDASGTDLSIIRPSLVYAANAKANFHRFRAAARRGLPLPLGGARAKRSMVSIDNLNDAILTLASSSQQNSICLPADADDLTVAEIYSTLCSAAGHHRVFLPPAPRWAMRGIMTLAGQSEMFDSLFRKAVVDRHHWSGLGWAPKQTVHEGLAYAMLD